MTKKQPNSRIHLRRRRPEAVPLEEQAVRSRWSLHWRKPPDLGLWRPPSLLQGTRLSCIHGSLDDSIGLHGLAHGGIRRCCRKPTCKTFRCRPPEVSGLQSHGCYHICNGALGDDHCGSGCGNHHLHRDGSVRLRLTQTHGSRSDANKPGVVSLFQRQESGSRRCGLVRKCVHGTVVVPDVGRRHGGPPMAPAAGPAPGPP